MYKTVKETQMLCYATNNNHCLHNGVLTLDRDTQNVAGLSMLVGTNSHQNSGIITQFRTNYTNQWKTEKIDTKHKKQIKTHTIHVE